MNKLYSCLVLAALLYLNNVTAQTLSLTKISEQRVEVANRLDNSPLSLQAAEWLAPYKQKVDSIVGPVLGESALFMNADRPESLLGNWAADVLLDVSKDMKSFGLNPKVKVKPADLAVVNIGGLRSSMPKGKVTVGDIMEISPFNNSYVIVTLSGEKLLDLFQSFAIYGGEGVSHGVELVYDSEGKLITANLNGKPIGKKSLYRIATLDYLAEGNDNMIAFRQNQGLEQTGIFLRDVFMQYIRTMASRNKQITSLLEGRIRMEQPAKKETVKLFITHTNDTHSCIQPINPNLSDTAQADKAGYLRRVALVDELRQQHPDNMLLFDCGDFSQGSPYYNLFKGEVEVELMNRMSYDAGTIGNHEFDFGLENMARIFRLAHFPIVCSNYDFTGTHVEGITQKHIILNKNGVKVGVFALCPPLAGLVSADNYKTTKYLDPIEIANKEAEYLRNTEKCDLVVCLSHLGWNAETINDQILISHTRNIDIVLGGHTHTYFESLRYVKNLDGKEIPCNQMGKNARFVGTIELEF